VIFSPSTVNWRPSALKGDVAIVSPAPDLMCPHDYVLADLLQLRFRLLELNMVIAARRVLNRTRRPSGLDPAAVSLAPRAVK
jgi:hypothetical protein